MNMLEQMKQTTIQNIRALLVRALPTLGMPWAVVFSLKSIKAFLMPRDNLVFLLTNKLIVINAPLKYWGKCSATVFRN